MSELKEEFAHEFTDYVNSLIIKHKLSSKEIISFFMAVMISYMKKKECTREFAKGIFDKMLVHFDVEKENGE